MNLEMSRRGRKLCKKRKRELAGASKKSMQQEEMIIEETKDKKGVELLELSPGVKIYLDPDINYRLYPELFSLHLKNREEELTIWLDIEEKTLEIGNKSYEIAGDTLFERKPIPVLGPFKPIKRCQLAKDDDGAIIINLRAIEGNPELDTLLRR